MEASEEQNVEVESRVSDLELQAALVSNKVDAHIKSQDKINDKLERILDQVSTSLYGPKDSPEDGIVSKTNKNSKYIEKKLSWKNDVINYVYRSLILVLILWMVNNMVSISSFLEGLTN